MAIAPVVIEFLAKGVPQIQQAFKSIQDSAIRAERAQTAESERGTRSRISAADREAKAKIAAYKFADRIEAQARVAGVREAARAEREKTREAERAAKAKIAAFKSADRYEAQARAAGVREAAKAERDKVREAARGVQEAKRLEKERTQAIKDRISSTKQAERDLDAWQRRAQQQRKQETREEQRAARGAERSAGRDQRESNRVNSARGRMAEAIVGAGARGVISGLQRSGNIATGLATTAAQLGGGFSIADAVMGEKNLRQQAAVLSASTILSGAGPGSEHGRAYSTDEVLKNAKAVGISQAIDPSEVLAGYDEIKKLTGNMEKAVGVMPSAAKLATATGAKLSDVSQLAGNILAANPNISNEEMDKQLRLFTRQGVVGGVEVSDFSKYGSRITAGASKYGGNQEHNEAVLGAMAQMARQYGGAHNAAEATIGAQRFGDDIVKHADSLKAGGIQISDGKGRVRDAQSIILDVLDKTGGDVLKLGALGLGARGARPLEGAAAIYRNAGGGKAGREAVEREFGKYTTATSKEEIEAANQRVLSEQKVEMEMEKLRVAAGEQLLPVFVNMIPALKELLPAFVDVAKVGIPAFAELTQTVADFVKNNKGLIDSLAAHPIGTLIAWELTKSFAEAGLPALLRGLFTGAFNGGPAPGAVTGAAGAAKAGSFASGSAVLAGAALQGYSIYDTISGIGDAQAAGRKHAEEINAMPSDKANIEIENARANSSDGHVAAAWGDRATRIFGAVTGGPLGIAAQYASDAAANALGVQNSGDVAKDTFASKETLTVLNRIAAGVERNGSHNNSGPDGAGRSIPITYR